MDTTNGLIEDWHDATFLVADDISANVNLITKILNLAGCRNVHSTTDSRDIEGLVEEHTVDLLLLDLHMPHINGLEVIERLRARFAEACPPILVLTAERSAGTRVRALENGARDYLTKPFDQAELIARVRNLVEIEKLQKWIRGENQVLERRVAERTQELYETRLEIVRRLGRAAEYRDNETGNHILRMSTATALVGQHLGLDPQRCTELLNASPMHDIGKIGIPDAILLKPGRLTDDEWRVMKTHTLIGADLLRGTDASLLELAASIAEHHHERWDGSGYPHGLVGAAIPLEARITAVCDVYDALTSERPYKTPWPEERATRYMREQRGGHFDPTVLDAFLELLPQIRVLRIRYGDTRA
ncbi:MAG: response regulator [Gammaproteobacteria bacterium]|nr:response regulator [Gammaproteobacteria bacterium]MCP5199019.1 response regulator [Gammaproteobacteria bacterium]